MEGYDPEPYRERFERAPGPGLGEVMIALLLVFAPVFLRADSPRFTIRRGYIRTSQSHLSAPHCGYISSVFYNLLVYSATLSDAAMT